MTRWNHSLMAGLLLALLTFASSPVQGDVRLSDGRHQKKIQPDCAFPKLEMTPETKVHAVTAYFQAARSDGDKPENRLVKVTVNSPGEPVVLMLGSYEPTVWHISWTEGSSIKGVLVNSLYPQKVVGLLDEVPLMHSSPGSSGACAYYDVRAKGRGLKDEVALQLFGRRVDHFELALNDEQVLLGRPWPPGGKKRLAAATVSPDDLLGPKRLPPGMDGLREAISRGWIRKADRVDVDQYLTAVGRWAGLPDHLIAQELPQAGGRILGSKPYVVLSPDMIPPGLRDASPGYSGGSGGWGHPQSANDFPGSFILPEGLSRPLGDAQGFKFYSYDEAKPKPAGQLREAIAGACRFSGFNPPPDLKVFAVAGNFRRPLGVLLGQSDKAGGDISLFPGDNLRPDRSSAAHGPIRGLEVSLARVTVNSPEAPAALILDSDRPAIWHFSWTKGTDIAAVAAIGQSRPIIVGLPEGVPVLNIENKDNEPPTCPLISVSARDFESIAKVNRLSHQLFQRDVDEYSKDQDWRVLAGAEPDDWVVMTAEEFREEKFIDPHQPLRGEAGLVWAEDRGLIRKATRAEKSLWRDKYLQRLELTEEPPNKGRRKGSNRLISLPNTLAWVILSPNFIIPPELDGERIFIVPDNLPLPQGRPGSKALFLKMDGSCVGPHQGCGPEPGQKPLAGQSSS